MTFESQIKDFRDTADPPHLPAYKHNKTVEKFVMDVATGYDCK